MEIGRLCVKIAGRDAGKRCVVVEVLDNNYVLIDGETRRRKCNLKHLEPLNQTVELKKGADHEAVKKALKTLNIEVLETKPKKKGERPTKQRKIKTVEASKQTEEPKEKQAVVQEKKTEPEKSEKKAPPEETKPTKKPETPKKAESPKKETRPKKKPQKPKGKK